MSSSQTSSNPITLWESASLAAHNLPDSGLGAGSQTAIHRGMAVQTSEGNTVGHVAAVALNQEQQQATHILLVQKRQLLEYRLVPVELILQVKDEKVLLRIRQPAVDRLPAWHNA